ASGITCKVNTVLIPGVNDAHVPEISVMVRKLGAVLHNVMPHIPVEGSRFSKMGIGAPSEAHLQKTRRLCGEQISVMTHCRQCRADAVGLLTDIDRETARSVETAGKAGASCAPSRCGSKTASPADASPSQAPALDGTVPQSAQPAVTSIRAAVCSEGGHT